MQERTVCYSGYDKPSKNEIVSHMPKWSSVKNWPDSDRKRTTVCKDPNHNKLKKLYSIN